MSSWRTSRRTVIIAGLALVVPLLWFWGVQALGAAGHPNYSKALSDYGEAAIVGLVALFVVYASYRFGWAEQVGQNWLFIGLAAAMMSLGDITYGMFEVPIGGAYLLGADGYPPFPGLPDVFYVATYVFFSIAVIRSALAYRGLVDVRRPFIASLLAAMALLGVAWFTVLQPVLAYEDVSAAEKAMSIFYPVADILLELAPAIFIILVVRQLGTGRLAFPWIALAIGVTVLAIADGWYAVLEAQDLYVSGHVVDLGWAFGYAIMAVAASLARDVFEV